ncbi:glycoside hydrolase family 10 protein [Nostoc sp. CCY0012]|uniref:glycoside hydrolase family 10 protein n=1 Tax=Nostoc sp. CCY0012 TaxID=1056123 RepID=UPI0039C6F84E
MASKFHHTRILWHRWGANTLFKLMKLPLIERSLKRFSPILVLISFVAVLLLNSLSPAMAQLPRQEIRGVWITNNDFNVLKERTKVQEAMTQLRQLHFNTIYPVVWNSGYVMYPSAVAQRTGIQPFVFRGSDGHDILADLITQAHSRGLLAIPWFEFGFMAPPTSELALDYPQWLTQKRDGSQTSISAAGEVVWLNPFHPEVQQFITDLVVETVTQYDVDGIQFDDHMSLPYEFGYDPYTIALYTQETNNSPPSNPQDQSWMRWRADKITAFMVQLNQAVKARKPNAIFSVSPNYYDFAYKFQLQDWLAWMRQNIVDELIVQIYRPDLQSFVNNISRTEIQEAQQMIPTGIGIMTGLRNRPVPMQQIKSQVRAAQARGLGVTFFYYETLWNSAPEPPSQRIAGFQNLFPVPAFRSAMGRGE